MEHMIVLVDSDLEPVYTSRIWCVFESYTATVCKIPVDVATPQVCISEIRSVMGHPSGFLEIIAALRDLDAEKAVASHEGDEVRIKNLIRRTSGFAVVNETVKGA